MSADTFYKELWAEHGPQIASVGWSSIGAQLTRFNILREALVNPGDVLDVGCGFGDFSVLCSGEDYFGIDSNPKFIEEAQRKYPSKKFKCIDVMDLVPDKYVHVVANGVLTFHEQPIKIVQKMWDLTANTLAFTWLNTSLHDIKLAIDFCACEHYSIRHDYNDKDFAIFMYRFQA
jgi:2-polyprenyl-3-methyl-5-hydroxy-6-metoxy-1,4-benzoquinol methylase